MVVSSTSNRNVLVVLLIVIIVIVATTVIVRLNHHNANNIYPLSSDLKISGIVLKKPRVINAFELTADDGDLFTKTNLRGSWTLMFFGFTHCGYVCPTTLDALNKMVVSLRGKLPKRLIPKIVMVSVDPDRDSVDAMHKYVKSFNPNFVGVRGTLAELRQLTQQLNVVFTKVKSTNGGYMINHSNEIMVLDPNGNLRAFLSYPHKGPTMAKDYEAMMSSLKRSAT